MFEAGPSPAVHSALFFYDLVSSLYIITIGEPMNVSFVYVDPVRLGYNTILCVQVTMILTQVPVLLSVKWKVL